MYSRSAKGGEKGDPNRNPWLAKMGEKGVLVIYELHETFQHLSEGKFDF